MSEYPKFDQLHLFIDETGDISGVSDERLRAVGGVVYFGEYDASVDLFLREILKRRLEGVGGKFPRDLHFFDSSLDFDEINAFLKDIGDDLRQWQAVDEQRLYGVVMVHAEDIAPGDGRDLVAETERDNRYVRMMWALVESLIFLDSRVSERLTPDWTLHLHVASRKIPFKGSREERVKLEGFGYEFANGKKEPFLVHTLSSRDLHRLMQTSLWQRWPARHIDIGSIEVPPIEYGYAHKASLAGMYLADLYLGQFRSSKLQGTKLNLMPTFREYAYGPWHEIVVELRRAADDQAVEAFLDRLAQFENTACPKDSRYQSIVKRLFDEMTPVINAHPERLVHELEEATREVDAPGQASTGMRRAAEAHKLLGEIGHDAIESELLYLQTKLSWANHSGDIELSDAIWEAFLNLEPRLSEMGSDSLRLEAEIRNRRAVALTDHFRLDEARATLLTLIKQQEDIAELMSQLRASTQSVLNQVLGACYGTLGQVEAFAGQWDAAQSFFRTAIEMFDDTRDIERQWVYLGHVACGCGDAALWKEVVEALTSLGSANSAIASGSQYVLELSLKAQYVFDTPAQNRAQLAAWRDLNILDHFTDEERRHHPFGLIEQLLGMLNEKVAREAKDLSTAAKSDYEREALRHYESAASIMGSGGALLELLGLAATLRARRLEASISNDEAHRRRLGSAFRHFRNHIQRHFGDIAWAEAEDGSSSGVFGHLDSGHLGLGPGHPWHERATSVLGAIRFNYW